jgi:hypothetical protein
LNYCVLGLIFELWLFSPKAVLMILNVLTAVWRKRDEMET